MMPLGSIFARTRAESAIPKSHAETAELRAWHGSHIRTFGRRVDGYDGYHVHISMRTMLTTYTFRHLSATDHIITMEPLPEPIVRMALRIPLIFT